MRLLPTLCALLTLSSFACSAPDVKGFAWKDASGQGLGFSQSASWPEGGEGFFSPERNANRYALKKAIGARGGQSLVVAIKRDGDIPSPARVEIALSSKADSSSQVSGSSFPLLGEESRIGLALDSSNKLSSVSIKALEGSFRVESLSIESQFKGIDRRAPALRVSSDFTLATKAGASEYSLRRPFFGLPSQGRGEEASRRGIFLSYGRAPLGSSLRIEALLPDGTKRAFSLRCRPFGSSTALDEGIIPVDTETLTLAAPKGVEVSAFYAAELQPSEYDLADLGRVLLSDAPIGRFALYRWDLIPSVLVFDFKDYATQDRYLKRLAFFVEKIGYRGKLMRDEDIASLHGWNAHDYRAEDLASFFQTARDKAFALGAEEKELLGILEGAGIVIEAPAAKGASARLEAGSGAIISITRESSDALRWTFAVHESTHAIFFADAAYREFARSQWALVDKGERWFWKTYFAWAAYDSSSDYLMGNEFQAYLLQQPVNMAAEYFQKRKTAELLEKHPELQGEVDAYMLKYGDLFETHARSLEAWLYAKYAVAAGKTVFLTRSRD